MSTRVVDQVDTWDEGSFSGGYRALHELADREFSGVVRAGGAELYMTRGVPVGIRSGEMEAFESSGTSYEAPADALPLLAVMQERNDEVKAKYYTEKTSISKVDQTLSDGGFTGFVELAENVLSGDYYLVYQAGKSMSVGYVGESGRLISGDEAFETADGEVGIYEVRPAEIEPLEIPEPEEPPEGTEPAGGTAAETDPAEAAAGGSASADDDAEPGQPAGGADDGPEPRPDTSDETGGTERTADEGSRVDEPESPQRTRADDSAGRPAAEDGRSAETDQSASPRSDPTTATEQEGPAREGRTAGQRGRTEETAPTQRQSGRQQPENRHETRGDSRQTSQGAGRESVPDRESRRASQRERTSQPTAGSQGLETKAVPSLDPDQTAIPDRTGSTGGGVVGSAVTEEPEPERPPESATRERQPPEQSVEPAKPERQEPAQGRPSAPEQAETGSPEPEQTVDSERVESLEAEIEERDEEIERLEDELESATEEQDRLEAELKTLEDERDELATEVERLEGELETLEEELGAAVDAEQRITAGEALAGTDIFVRYRSKGKPTLEKAHGASTRKDEVNENLRLEKHTQFDDSTVAVGGQSYQEFLESTLEYQFVRWVVRELLFEIRDTGHEKELGDLYDVLPQIDRAELSGVVDVVYNEDGQETQSQESFDVVLRNRMGHPLLVANLNDTREATTEGMMERLITAAERVGQSSDTFSGAFLVTESFFDPGALEVASSATQGGLLSRDKRKSFVNLSRKTGYHLCLVEARNENFHLAVPEL
jgi:hypothetical protein